MAERTVAYGVSGASGRMGRRIIALATEQPERFKLVTALNRASIGQDAGVLAGVGALGVKVASASALEGLLERLDVLIDFSAPVNTRGLIATCRSQRVPMLIGTTGLTGEDHKLIDAAAKDIAVLQATNTSLGVTLLLNVAAQVARQLGPDYDIEIVEAHHNQKKDAPSGTALSLAEAIVAATGRTMEKDVVFGRQGAEALRQKGTVGMHSLRMGDVVGDHTIYFATPGERVEVRHIATTRDTFARGALRAAAWLAGKPPGRYSMHDVLSPKS